MYDAGHRKVLMVTTSAYSCYSSCRQYREDIGMALTETGLDGRLEVDKVRQYSTTPASSNRLLKAPLPASPTSAPSWPRPAPRTRRCTSCSPRTPSPPATPKPRAAPTPNRATSRKTPPTSRSAGLRHRGHPPRGGRDRRHRPWSLVYQSRSGAPHVPWLEPDINDAIEELAGQGVKGIVIVPLGFVSDHMEVVWDLDTEALETCGRLGLAATDVPTPGRTASSWAGSWT